MDFAGSIRREDDEGPVHSLHRSDLGDGDLPIREHLEQEGLEGLVGPIEFIDQQHGGPRRAECRQQRTLQQHLPRIQALGGFGAIADRARFSQANMQQLSTHVPLVGRLRHIQALIALQPNQGRVHALRQHLGQLGLADAGLALQKERSTQLHRQEQGRGQTPVGQISLAGQHRLQCID
jgi:hypothetical protein